MKRCNSRTPPRQTACFSSDDYLAPPAVPTASPADVSYHLAQERGVLSIIGDTAIGSAVMVIWIVQSLPTIGIFHIENSLPEVFQNFMLNRRFAMPLSAFPSCCTLGPNSAVPPPMRFKSPSAVKVCVTLSGMVGTG